MRSGGEIKARRLKPSEAAKGCEAAEALFGGSASERHMASFLEDEGNYFLVAGSGGAVAGGLLAYRLVRVKDEGFKIFLYDIEVSKELRRAGTGSALISELLSIARSEGAVSVFGITNRSYVGAKEFYVATGASIAGEVEILFEYKL